MHIVQISPYVVHPPSDGGSHRSHGLVATFPACGGRVDRYCQGVSSGEYRDRDLRREVRIDNGYVEHRHIHPLHDVAKLPMLLGYPNIFSNRALSLFPGPLRTLADDADVALVRQPWQVPAVNDLLDCPIVYSSHNVEIERFTGLREGSTIDRWLYRRVRQLERAAVSSADFLICTSIRDAERYRKEFGYAGPKHVAPNATDRRNLRDPQPESAAAARVRERHGFDEDVTLATFVGSDHPPNVEAVKTLLRMVDRVEADIQFLVVGLVCDAISSTPENVTLAGFVDDIDDYFDATDVALNPMVSGGGTNVKLLDYFARSLAVVSTPFGVRGVDAEDGKQAVITDIDGFPAAIDALADDPTRRERLGTRARKLVERRYTWETVSCELYNVLQERYGGRK